MCTYGLIDERPIMRLGLKVFLEQHFEKLVFHSARKVSELPESGGEQSIDILIIGFNPDSKYHWLDLVEQCKTAYPQAVLIIHGENLPLDIVNHLLKVGVHGLILMLNDPSQLIQCIKAVQDGRHYLSPQFEQIFGMGKEKSNEQPAFQSQGYIKSHPLTLRQYRLASFLAKGMKVSEIANKLKVSPSTISNTKAVIMKKMKTANIIELNNALNEKSLNCTKWSELLPA